MLVTVFPHPPDPEPECMARAMYVEGGFCKVCGFRWDAHKKAQRVHGLLRGEPPSGR
jgi:hypothetical protein